MADLAHVLRALPLVQDPRVLVGLSQPDDAAVVRLRDDLALVFTTDFFTPVVDDARTFGRIAAANALSDVYAMGAQPLVALNIAAFPTKTLPLEILAEILAGGAEAAAEAGIVIAGGHTVDDPEPKYGLAVVGTVHPEQVWRKGGLREGDALVLTKPLGTGVLSTALKRGLLTEKDAPVRAMVASMSALNARAAKAVRAAGITPHAVTDVTGYGLAGHLREMLRGSEDVGATVELAALPVLEGALELAEKGVLPGGTRANREHLGEALEVDAGAHEARTWLACDAQTSGGLLLGVSPEDLEGLRAALQAEACEGAVLGRVERGPARVRLR